MGQHYKLPDGFDQSDVVDLTPETQLSAELKPTSMVTCINRGPKEIRDMYDAQPYIIPPYAKFRVEYQVAAHLQRRNIVPGTRNPDPVDSSAPQYVPWIAIVGLDRDYAPFTADELAAFGESVEGLNRHLLSMSGDRDVSVKSTGELRKTLPGMGVASSFGVAGGTAKPDQKVLGGTEETRAAALEKVEGSDAVTTSAEALGAGWIPPANVEETSAPAPVPLKGRRGR